MSRGYNLVVLKGGLVRDPDVRYTVDGKPIVRFTLACGYARKQADGTYQEEVDYPQCLAFGHTANAIAKYCKKGSQIIVEGKIKTGSYEAKDGTRKYTTEVMVREITFIGGKKDSENTEHGQTKANGCAPDPYDNAELEMMDLGDDREVDVPF
jgi:single-strand DNA-binding protein